MKNRLFSMKREITALILSVALVIGVLPIGALAVEDPVADALPRDLLTTTSGPANSAPDVITVPATNSTENDMTWAEFAANHKTSGTALTGGTAEDPIVITVDGSVEQSAGVYIGNRVDGINVPTNVIINGINNAKITASASYVSGTMIYTKNGANVSILGVTIDADAYDASTKTITKNGANIRAIIVDSAATVVNLDGGTVITGGYRTAARGGGGVDIYGTLNMYNATVTNCGSGAIAIEGKNPTPTLNMYDGARIVGNDNAIKYGAGGVALSDKYSTFNMYGGVISDNTSIKDESAATTAWGGGGVLVRGGTFNMYGGVISNNVTSQAGGGVMVTSDNTDSTVNIKGGSIIDNICCSGDTSFANEDAGGGINVINSSRITVTLSDKVTLSGNMNGLTIRDINKIGENVKYTYLNELNPYIEPDPDPVCVNDINIMFAVGMLEGYPDGTFRPEANLTRAEAATLIYKLRHGGSKEGAEEWADAHPFKDVSGWAAGYIGYCYTYNIIIGRSETVFDPNAPVKANEFAKMLLTAIGYRADAEGFNDTATWQNKVIVAGYEAGIFEGVNTGINALVPRQWIAKMMVNSLDVIVPEYVGNWRVPVGTDLSTKQKAGDKYLDIADPQEMLIISNDKWSILEKGSLSGTAYTSTKKLAAKGNVLAIAKEDIAAYIAGTTSKTYELPVEDAKGELVGTMMTVVFKNDGSYVGSIATGKSQVGALTIAKDTDADGNDKYTVKIGDKTYLDAKAGTETLTSMVYEYSVFAMRYVSFGTESSSAEINGITKADTKGAHDANGTWLVDLALVYGLGENVSIADYYDKFYNLNRDGNTYTGYDWDGDGKIDAVIGEDGVVGEVTEASSTQYKFMYNYNPHRMNYSTVVTMKISDYNVAAIGDVKKGSVVLVTGNYKTGETTLKELNIVIGVYTQIDEENGRYTIGGTAYTLPEAGETPYGFDVGKNKTAATSKYGKNIRDDTLLGLTIKVAVDGKNNIVYAEGQKYTPTVTVSDPESINLNNIAYVIGADIFQELTTDTIWGSQEYKDIVKVKLMNSNGQQVVHTYDAASELEGIINDTDAEALCGKLNALKGKIVEFKMTTGGAVIFEKLSKATKVIYGSATASGAATASAVANNVEFNYNTQRFGNILTDYDTLAFVSYKDGDGNTRYAVMRMSQFESGIDGTTFNVVARNSETISTALIVTTEIDGTLPGTSTAPSKFKSVTLFAVTGKYLKNIGKNSDGEPINVAAFSAIDLATGKIGEYTVEDTKASIEAGEIYAVSVNNDGMLSEASAPISFAELESTLGKNAWYIASVTDKGVNETDNIIRIGDMLISENVDIASACMIFSKQELELTAAKLTDITKAELNSSKVAYKNIVLHTDSKGKIDTVIFTADGSAYLAGDVDHQTPTVHAPNWGEGVVTKPATCQETGEITYTCQIDGCGLTKVEELPKSEHDWNDGVETTAATCEADGLKTYTCQTDGCGKTKTETITKLGHSWNDGVETTAATCETDGVKTYTCANCGKTKTETITKLGHNWVDGDCTRCHKYLATNDTANDMTWDNFVTNHSVSTTPLSGGTAEDPIVITVDVAKTLTAGVYIGGSDTHVVIRGMNNAKVTADAAFKGVDLSMIEISGGAHVDIVGVTLDAAGYTFSTKTAAKDALRCLNVKDAGTTVTLDGNTVLTGGISKSVYKGTGVELVGATLNLYDVKITSCSTGAAVFAKGGTFNMYDGAIITQNRCSAAEGTPGVFLRDNSTFNMYGGRIVDNDGAKTSPSATSTWGTGGVFVRNATFIMNGGEISGNISTQAAGGVAVQGSDVCTVKLYGGTITGNTANSAGKYTNAHAGGLWINSNAKITYGISENCTIADNINGDAQLGANAVRVDLDAE